MSQVLSGLIPNLLGSGALKLGGGAIVELLEPSDEALIENKRLGLVWRENGAKIGAGARFRAPAMAFGALIRKKKMVSFLGF